MLSGLSAVAAVGCAPGVDSRARPGRDPAPLPGWVSEAVIDDDAFPWIAAGDVDAGGAALVASTGEAAVSVIVVRDRDGQVVAARSGVAAVDGFVRVELPLPADEALTYTFVTPDGARSSRPGRLRTPPAAGDGRVVVLGATSCLGHADPDYPSLGYAAAESLDAFLLLGDTVYANGPDLTEYRRQWSHQLRKDTVRALLEAVPVVAVWDDHEVANDWTFDAPITQSQTTVSPERVADARRAFDEALPRRLGPDGSGLWRAVRFGDVLIVALDLRGERGDGRIVSDAQLAWVEQVVRDAPEVFKLVLTSVHLTDHTASMGDDNAVDRWQGYPAQRSRLVALAEEVPGVLFVSGDMHYGGLQRLAAPGLPGAGIAEIAVGPAGSVPFGFEAWADKALGGLPPQYERVLDDWSWTRMTFDPVARTVVLAWIGDDGAAAAELTLRV
ncbi:MAG: alkaline phosphatase D family protein [Myxococcota bacterium]